ncbi:MAG: STAS domain-containing protein [Mangrovicoccus sp.]|nr:STAS domain-containing protein [Mangrovicoccus sp.]
MTAALTLPDRLDISSCQALLPRLLELRAQDLEADGSSVKHIGAIGAQFLISAKNSWEKDASRFAVHGLSEAMIDSLRELGLTPEQVGVATEDPS